MDQGKYFSENAWIMENNQKTGKSNGATQDCLKKTKIPPTVVIINVSCWFFLNLSSTSDLNHLVILGQYHGNCGPVKP